MRRFSLLTCLFGDWCLQGRWCTFSRCACSKTDKPGHALLRGKSPSADSASQIADLHAGLGTLCIQSNFI